MKGYGITKDGSIGWIEKEVPELGRYDALIRPLAVAAYDPATYKIIYDTIHEPGTELIIGHEAAGVVEAVGEDVKDFKPGDRVLVPTITPDFRTTQVQDIGMPQHSGGFMDGWRLAIVEDGALAERFRVFDADMNLAILPDEVSLEAAVMISDMMTTAFHGAELAEIDYGDTVVVYGIGGVGQLALAAAKLKGAARIIGIGSRPILEKIGKEYGMTDFVNYRNGDVVEQVLELTGGVPVDKVIIAGGGNSAIGDSFAMVKIGGVVGSINHFSAGEFIEIPRLAWGEGIAHKKFNAGLTQGGRVRMERMLSLVKHGRIDPSKIVTHKYYGMEELEKAMTEAGDKGNDFIRGVIIFEE